MINDIIGLYYINIHLLFFVFIGFVGLMSNNLQYLTIILIIALLDLWVNIVWNECPLSVLETKYLKFSNKSEQSKYFRSLGINYKCKHYYENQIDIISTGISIISAKIGLIIIFKKILKFQFE